MKKILFLAIITSLSFSCGFTAEDSRESTTDKVSIPTEISTVKVNEQLEEIEELPIDRQLEGDSLSYIGFVEDFYFVDDNEVYIQLYFKNDSLLQDDYMEVVDLADSIIYQDGDNTRSMISFENAETHLDLRGKNSISIFDKSNKFVEKVKLQRIEYLDQNIESYFVAVYRLTNKIELEKGYYCIGNISKIDFKESFKYFKDTTLTNNFADRFKLNQEFVHEEKKGIHFQSEKSKSVISILNDNEYSLIYSNKIDSNYIYKSEESENIHKVQIIPIFENNNPIILIESHMPEGDVSWTSLLCFDGLTYKRKDKQKTQITTGANKR